MAKLGYTVEFKIESMARAYGREMPIPWKKAVELARALRGKKVETALEYLDNVIALKQAVPFKRYKRWVAHKAGIGPARYPVKAAQYFKRVLESAVSNADYLGREEPDSMVIKVINPHKGAITKGQARRAHGTSTPWNQDTVNLEIVLEEVE